MSFIKLNQLLGASFARTSSANKKDGTTVTAGNVRYENAADTPVINKQRLWDRGTHTRTIAGTNLLTANQSSIETNTVGFSNSNGYLTGSTMTRDTGVFWAGTASLKVVCTNASNQQGAGASATATTKTNYTGSVYVQAPNGTTLTVALYDTTNGSNGGFFPTVNFTADGTWQRVQTTCTMGNANGAVALQVFTNGTQNVTFYMDGLQIEQGNVATSWVLGGTSTALALSPAPMFVRSGSAYNQIGQAINNATPRYGSVIDVLGATNLLTVNQSNIETDTTGLQAFTAGAFNSGATVTRDTTNFYQGTASLKVVTTSATDQQGGGALTSATANTTYTYSAMVLAPVGALLAVVAWDNTNGTNGGTLNGNGTNFVGTGSWQAVTVTFTMGAANTSNLQLGVKTRVGSATAVTFYIDAIQLERNSVATPWILGGTNRPTTYLQDGVFIEEGATNICTFSEQLGSLSLSAVTVTADAVYAPNGTLTADKVVNDTTNAQHAVYRDNTFTVNTGLPGTISVYAKAAELNWLILSFGPLSVRAWFNLATGIVGTVLGTGVTAKMTYAGDGWYRCSVSKTSLVTGEQVVQVHTSNADNVSTYTGVAGQGIYVWGVQAEAKGYATSYIPTPSNASVSRSAEILTVPANGVFNPAQGTVVVRAYVDGDLAATGGSVARHPLINMPGQGVVLNTFNAATTTYRGGISGTTGTTYAQTNINLSQGWHTFAVRWSPTAVSLWIDGLKKNENLAPAIATMASGNIEIGYSSGLSSQWDSAIEEINFFNSALSDADMLVYTQASGSVIPMRSETTWKAEFDGNLNFATSGVYVSEWFNVGASGAIFSGYSAPNNAASGCVYLYEFQTSDSDTQATASAWVTNPATITGKYIRARITMVSTLNNSTVPSTTSLSITPADTSKSATLEEGTVNLLSSPASPTSDTIFALTQGGSYTLSTYGTEASSGSVTTNHYYLDDFNTGAASGTIVNGSGFLGQSVSADPTFTRTGAAAKRNGTQVQSGYSRYENVIKNALVQSQGDWDAGTKTNTVASPGVYVPNYVRYESMMINNSADWTSGGDTPGTWTWDVTSQRIVASGSPVQGTYLFNNFSAKDSSIEATMTQAQDGGLILRYQDNNNYYMLAIEDDTAQAALPTAGNFAIYKRVGGTFTAITSFASADVTFVRGVSNTIRFEAVGSELKLYYNGALVTSVIDTAITAAGKAGLRYSGGTPNGYFTSLKIAQMTTGGKLTVGQFVDGFDVDSTSQYTFATAANSITPTFNTAQSRLELTTTNGSSVGSALFNNLTAKDISVEATMTQSVIGGLILRAVDALNYYVLLVQDNTTAASNNVTIYKVVAGNLTALGIGSITATWARGATATFRFEAIGTELKAFLNGSLILSVTDSTYTAAGKVGMYQNSGTATYFTSFTVDQLAPIFARASVANMTDGTQVVKNAPRYEYGRNLCSKNMSDVETDTTGFSNSIAPDLGGGGTFSRTTTQFWQGTASIKNDVTGQFQGVGFNLTGLKASTTYTFSVYLNIPTGNSAQVLCYDQTNSVQGSATTVTGNSAWQRGVTSITTGATGNATVSFHFRAASGSGTFTMYADGFQVEQGASATTWGPGGPNTIMIEESATNIFTSGQSTVTAVAGSAGTFTRATAAYDPFTGATITSGTSRYPTPNNNWCQYTEALDSTWWTKTRSSIVPNAASAPDLTVTADKLVEDSSASTTHYVLAGVTLPNTGVAGVFSIYAKAGERSAILIQWGTAGTHFAYYDLAGGTVASFSGSGITASITAVGGGWYRCALLATSIPNSQPSIFLANTTSNAGYTGNGTSGVYLWGAQVEAGSTVTGYQSSAGVDEATSNLLTANQSNVETNTTGFTAVNSSTISRDTTEFWQGTASLKTITPNVTNDEGVKVSVAGTVGTTYTTSFYVKGSGTIRGIILWYAGAGYISQITGPTITLTNSWQRVTLTGTAPATTDTVYLQISTATTQAATFYVDGLQIETKPYATAWIVGGNTRAVVGSGLEVEENASNILTANQSQGVTASGTVGTGTVTNTGSDTTRFWEGTGSIKTVCDGTALGQGLYNGVVCSASTQYACSAWVWAPAGTTMQALITFNNTAGTSVVAQNFVATGTWQRVVSTGISGGTDSAVNLIIRTNTTAQAVTFWTDGWQIEQKAYATSWVLGGATRNAELFTVPVAGALQVAGGAMVARAYVTGDLLNATVTGSHYLFDVGDTNNRIILYNAGGSPGNYNVQIRSGGVTNTYTWAAALTEGWHTFAVRWDGTSVYLYVNGALRTNGLTSAPVSLPGTLFIGSNISSANQWNGPIAWAATFKNDPGAAACVSYTINSDATLPTQLAVGADYFVQFNSNQTPASTLSLAPITGIDNISVNTANFWEGTQSARVVTSGNATNEGIKTFFAATNTLTYTLSVWVKGTGTIQLKMDGACATTTGTATALSSTAWTRLTLTVTATSTGPIICYVQTNSAQSLIYYVDGLQVEQKSYATSWVQGGTTRATEYLRVPTTLIPATGMPSGAIIMRYYHSTSTPSSNHGGALSPFGIGSLDGSNPTSIQLYMQSLINVRLVDKANNVTSLTGALPSVGWNTIGISWNPGYLSLYLNGTKLNSTTATIRYPNARPEAIVIGASCFNTGTQEINGAIDEFNMFDVFLTDSEMATYTAL